MRNERYRELIPEDRLRHCACTVIGVGAIGRQIALQLAAVGVGRIQLIDFDVVEPVNLGTQAFLERDVGRLKVDATGALIRQVNQEVQLETLSERFARSMTVHEIVCCCVDSISTRRHIWSALEDRVNLFIDGRMAAEVFRIVTVSDAETRNRYRSTLFRDEEAHQDRCTTRSTVYCASIAAGWMVGHLARWLRGLPVEFDVTCNLLASELSIA